MVPLGNSDRDFRVQLRCANGTTPAAQHRRQRANSSCKFPDFIGSASLVQVNICRDPKSLLWFTRELTIIIHGQFIFIMTVRIKSKAPFVVAKIPQTTQMSGCVLQTFCIFFFGFRPVRRRPVSGEHRLSVCVNVTELFLKRTSRRVYFPLKSFSAIVRIRFSTSACMPGGILMPPELGSSIHWFGVILCLLSFTN